MASHAATGKFALLAEAAVVIERGLDLEQKLQAVVETARLVTGARYGALGVLGSERRIARFITSGIADETVALLGAPPTGRGILGLLIDERRPLRLADITVDARATGFPQHHPVMHSFLGVPLQIRDQVFGNIYLTEAPGGEFTEEDEAVVILLAAKAGIAIENAALFAEANHQAAEARRAARAREGLNTIAVTILRERDVSRVMSVIAAEARNLVAARTVTIGVPDEVSATVRFPVVDGDDAAELRGTEIPLDGSLIGAVIQAGEPMRVDVTTSPSMQSDPLVERVAAHSLVAVPISGGDETIAAIVAIDHAGGEPFSAEDQQLLDGLSALGAVALATARAFGRERARSDALARLRKTEAEAQTRRVGMQRIVETQERERQRIAQDLHDRTAGALTAVQIGLKRLERERDATVLQAGLVELRHELAGAIEDLRDVIVDLRPKVLDDFGLGPAIERLCDSLARRSGLVIDAAWDPAVGGIRPELASAAFRVVQEALMNAVRHAQARRVGVSATVDNETLVVVIEDDGVGVTSEPATGPDNGYGIRGMQERAALIGGALSFARPTSGGTRVCLEAPL
jgi:signal transduction histidine kinase